MEFNVRIFQSAPKVPLGELLQEADEINSKGLDLPFYGVNKDKEFMPTIATTKGLNSKKYKIGVVLTAFTKGNKQPQNSAFVINKSGDILMKYSKVHTCDFTDERNVESGKEFKVCDFEGIQLGIMICYDREYPESARILMLKGAEVILVPNDCGSMQPRIRALSTRAYENMVAVAMANPNGDNAGCSCAFSPICWDRNGNCVDNTVLLADDNTEGIFYAEFDMEAIREYRNREMLGNTFRKVEAYNQLLSKEINEPFIREGQNR